MRKMLQLFHFCNRYPVSRVFNRGEMHQGTDGKPVSCTYYISDVSSH